MIIETIDHGWGAEHPIKQMEIEIVDRYIRSCQEDSSRTVVINSTWYSQDLHEKVHARLKNDPPDRVILISLLDAPIARPDQFQDVVSDVRCVGYYPGPDYIDFCCFTADKYMTLPDIDLLDESAVDTAFMCLNRKPHWHRVRLFEDMQANDLLDRGLVSMGGSDGRARRLLPTDAGGSDIAPNGGLEQNGIANDIMTLGHPDNWRRHFLNVVTETLYDVSTDLFLTEKTHKPIMGLRPFLIYATDGGQRCLDAHGFQSYIKDFSDITDLDLGQPDNMVPFLRCLTAQDSSYWRHKLVALREKILYNRDQFDRHVAFQRNRISRGIECLT